jgi:hypothetical protein
MKVVDTRIAQQNRTQDVLMKQQQMNQQQNNSDRDHALKQAEFNAKYTSGKVKSIISDLDIKKSNELMPTVLEIDIQYMSGDTFKTTTLLLGIKCVAHDIATSEMTYFVAKSVKEERLIFRLIQWSTGEIKFWKDLVFTLDRIKSEVSATGKSSRWWSYLRSRGKMNKFRAMLGVSKFIPNATMVLSMQEVEMMKNKDGVDIFKNVLNAAKLCNIFFLLGLVILDDIAEVAYIFDDEAKTWNFYSYQALEKERKSGDKDLKSLISLINR